MAISYGLTEFMGEGVSSGTQLEVLQKEMFPRITRMSHLKDYLHKSGDILGIDFNKDILKTNDKRIGIPASWSGDSLNVSASKFKEFLDKVLPIKTKIVDLQDTVDGLKNPSKSYMGFTIQFDVRDKYPSSKSLKYLINLAGIQKRSVGTEYQESGFLFALASSFKFSGDDIFNLSYWKSECRGKIFVDGKSYSDSQVEDIYNFSIGDDWKSSLLYSSLKVKEILKEEPLEYHKDSSKFFLNILAKKLYEKAGWSTKWNNDKWNPADVWFIYDSGVREVVKEYSSLAELNGYLKQSVDNSSGIVGLSLKKFEKGGSAKIVDMGKELKVVDSFEIVFGALFTQGINQNLVMKVPNSNKKDKVHSISYRLFQSGSREMIRGEVVKKGTEASHGKVFLSYIDSVSGTSKIVDTVNKVRGDGNIEYKNGRYSLTSKGKKRFRLVSIMYKRHIKNSPVVSTSLSARTKIKPNLRKEYEAFEQGSESFEIKLNEYIQNNFSGKSVNQVITQMSVRINATFQNIAFAGWWSVLAKSKSGKYNSATETATKMLYFGMSMADFSSVHLKIGG
tara:strand:- start:36 stop:1724 length:1689 start_codon:yes stop_codon:yes gene_type:complete